MNRKLMLPFAKLPQRNDYTRLHISASVFSYSMYSHGANQEAMADADAYEPCCTSKLKAGSSLDVAATLYLPIRLLDWTGHFTECLNDLFQIFITFHVYKCMTSGRFNLPCTCVD